MVVTSSYILIHAYLGDGGVSGVDEKGAEEGDEEEEEGKGALGAGEVHACFGLFVCVCCACFVCVVFLCWWFVKNVSECMIRHIEENNERLLTVGGT